MDGYIKKHIKAIENAFNAWKAPWTSARAAKLDELGNVKSVLDKINGEVI